MDWKRNWRTGLGDVANSFAFSNHATVRILFAICGYNILMAYN